MTRRRSPPPLSPEDAELWRRVTTNVRPLRSGRKSEEPEDETRSALAPSRRPQTPRPVPTPARPAEPPPAPSPGAVDKRLVRRIGRGRAAAEAVLDLHGMSQREAFPRLLAFLRQSQTAGRRLVLVVTGKGRFDERGDWWQEGARGVLRRAVPDWLSTPEFRPLVVGYRQAHDRKGGEGALYVQIRRKRPGDVPR